MRESKDFVIIVVSHPKNKQLRRKIQSSIKKFVPRRFNYSLHFETSGNNWNEGMRTAVNSALYKYTLKYGIILFDDDVYLDKHSFDNIEKYMKKYQYFQWRMKYENGKERPVTVKLVKTPMLALSVRNIIKKRRYVFPYFFMTGRKSDFDEPAPCIGACFSYAFLSNDCLAHFNDDFISSPYLYYGEDTLFSINMIAYRGIIPYTIPNFVYGVRGYTKDTLYSHIKQDSSVFFVFHYIMSRDVVMKALEIAGMIDLELGSLSFWKSWLQSKL